MKKSTNNIAKWMMPLSLGLMMMACSENDEMPKEGYSQVTLKSTAQGESGSSSENSRVDVGAMSVTSFQVGTKDMEMKYVSQAEINAGISIGNGTLMTNISAELGSEVSQEKSLSLVADGESKVEVIGEGETPNGNYSEVIFKLYQHSEGSAESEMENKSMLIMGEVEGKPTKVWLSAEKELRAVAESSQGYKVEGNTDMTVVFDMEAMFEGVNMSAALDGNSDGTVEIGPGNVDGNSVLYGQVENNLEGAVTLKQQ
ncbi:hypothetical protein KZP23_07020 [Echinicola marina]|uniref:hypothetical protein n=1 Tax=Echinicola marina TaxID=2859768 RepID=UPI001CF68863|nr:hypothetical protein [Echinicola marina]UCS94755.1 hypothetical protein KZP23_07020 [Echinicola marina]